MEGYAELSRGHKEQALGECLNTRMKECTFTPKISRSSERRGISRFLADQQKFNEKVRSEVNSLATTMLQREKSHCHPQPTIGEKSRQLARKREERSGVAIYERLYRVGVPAESKRNNIHDGPDAAGSKSAKSKSRTKADPARIERLYEEARVWEEGRLRRKEEREQKPKAVCRHIADPHIIARFDKEFNECIKKNLVGAQSAGENVWLDVEQVSKCSVIHRDRRRDTGRHGPNQGALRAI